MESDLMELQQFHGNVANFLYGMPLAQIRMHHLTPQLQHSKLEQLANKLRIRRHKRVYGPRTADFLKELGHRLRQVSGEASSFHYLAQRLSVAIQRGNSASVMGTMDGDGEEFFV
eukprot:Em0003g1773a